MDEEYAHEKLTCSPLRILSTPIGQFFGARIFDVFSIIWGAVTVLEALNAVIKKHTNWSLIIHLSLLGTYSVFDLEASTTMDQRDV